MILGGVALGKKYSSLRMCFFFSLRGATGLATLFHQATDADVSQLPS